ncbi:MAG: hypothetical protein HYX48_02560 [Chlamydiales bacterium]|nr:hypothetical protein [Chlamydiales bacterium]
MTEMHEELLVTAEDVQTLLRKIKPQLKRYALYAAALVVLLFSLKQPLYQATATFRQSTAQGEQRSELKSLLQAMSSGELSKSAGALMFSQKLGRPVIEKLGMQVSVHEKGLLTQMVSNLWGNISADIGLKRKKSANFVFRDVLYEGDERLALFLRFPEEGIVEVLDSKKKVMGVCKLGERFQHKKLSFTLEKARKSASKKKLYTVTVSPWTATLKQQIKRFNIKSSKLDKNILELTYANSNRKVAANFLNIMMAAYHDYLKLENDDLANAQLAYLDRRQAELTASLDDVLDEQSEYMKKNLGKDGFVGLKEEVEMLAIPKQAYTSKLFDLEVEQKRLKGGAHADARAPTLLDSQQKHYHDQLTNVSLQESSMQASPLTPTEFQKIEEEISKELQGINLNTAQSLYASYQNQLDTIQSKMRQLLYLRDRIHAPDFEISSLEPLLEDAVGRGVVQKAADIALQLRDQKNRSIKEILRLKESMQLEKDFLINHIDQTIELDKLRAKLVEEKIGSLQRICLNLLEKEKGLIGEKLEEISVKMEDLPEKWKLENHLRFKKELSMGVIEGISKVVETKNLHYNLFYVDSKPIDPALIPARLKPSGLFLSLIIGTFFAVAALSIFQLGRAISRGFVVTSESLLHYGLTLCGKLSHFAGAPLKELGHSDLETLRRITSFIGEKRSSNEAQMAVVVGGSSLDTAFNLAELLSFEGKRVLLVQSAFDRPVTPEQIPGLWHYLEGKIQAAPIQRRKTFDFLPTGGTSRHATELLNRASFKQLLEQQKREYDLILIYSTAKPALSEAHLFFKYADAIVVMTSDEKIEELAPYRKWNQARESSALGFVIGRV